MQVAKSVGKSIVRGMIVIVILECLLTAWVPATSSDTSQTRISTKSFSSPLWSTPFGQADEEKLEEKSHKTIAVELVDLSRNISFLAKIHAPPNFFITDAYMEDYRLSLQELFCVFIM